MRPESKALQERLDRRVKQALPGLRVLPENRDRPEQPAQRDLPGLQDQKGQQEPQARKDQLVRQGHRERHLLIPTSLLNS